MKSIYGNLLTMAMDGKFDAIVHGCNCFNTMGAGIAKQIKEQFQEAYNIDCLTNYGDKNKLGSYSYAKIYRSDISFFIINAYTQYRYSGKKEVRYNAIKKVFKEIKENFSGLRFGIPMIGAGLAGGDWKIISEIIETEMKGENIVLVKFKAK